MRHVHACAQRSAGSRFSCAHSSTPHNAQVPILVARYGGTPQLAARVEAAVRAQQNSDVAVAQGQAAARILERVVVEVSACRLCSVLFWGGLFLQAAFGSALPLVCPPEGQPLI